MRNIMLVITVSGYAVGAWAGEDVPPGTFVNPVYRGQDPYITRGADGYYYMATERPRRAPGVYLGKSKTLLAHGKLKTVYTPPRTGPFSQHLWAPEIHSIDGRWYIYTCADDGDNAKHRLIVLAADGDDPEGSYHFAAELDTPGWAIDATVYRHSDGKLYCLWSGWPAGVPADSTQHLYISRMKSPTQLEGPSVDISGKMYDWETAGRTAGLNEGPQVVTRGGKVFVVYSASGSWTAAYCLGLVVFDGDDLLDPAAWTKRPTPLFTRSKTIHGPGHCSFVKSPDGSEDWLVFHSSVDPAGSWNRRVSLKRITWGADGAPKLGRPHEFGEAVAVPSGEAGR